MYASKKRFLERLTPKFSSVTFGKKVEGSSPPGVFVGREGYPRVFVGPLVTAQKGDTTQLDTPEQWLPSGVDALGISQFRMQLARGMTAVRINDLDNRAVSQVRDIALSAGSLEANAEFLKTPQGYTFNEHHQPFGPSAPLKSIEIENVRYEKNMEKAYYDTDLDARNALVALYGKGLLVSQLQKALSAGTFGLVKRRKLVPTRWSITAVDDTLGKSILEEIKTFPAVDSYYVYEHRTHNNYFAIVLMPGQWQYEFLEAFIHIFGNEEMLFADHEQYRGRTTYAGMGGCYYSTRLAVAEHLKKIGRQAGVLVFRESYKGYIPLGVWLVRETSRAAMTSAPREFHSRQDALNYITPKLQLSMQRYRKESVMLKQTTLSGFTH